MDFDLLNEAKLPLVVTAIDVQTGQPVRFDTRKQPLKPAHFLASTAMPPFYPSIAIDGRWLADPGLVANLPLDPVLDEPMDRDLLCFAVDALLAERRDAARLRFGDGACTGHRLRGTVAANPRPLRRTPSAASPHSVARAKRFGRK